MLEDAVLPLLDNRKTIYEILCLIFCAAINSSAMHISLRRWIKADSHITCRAHAVLLPSRAAKGLECVFPI